MNNDFTLVCSYKNRIEQLEDMVDSADRCLPVEVQFLLVDGGSTYKTLRHVSNIRDRFNRHIRFLDCEPNTLWQAWNYGYIHSSTRYVIYTSSDVVFQNRGILDYFKFRLNEGYQYILAGNHAVFCVDKAALPKMGMWDEEFNNGPHADCDMLIRASEANIKIDYGPNNWYTHGDTPNESKERLSSSVEDRLPMNTLDNEKHFKSKWESNWPGWENAPDPLNLPHPPTHISQVKRRRMDHCPYPSYVEELREQYNVQ